METTQPRILAYQLWQPSCRTLICKIFQEGAPGMTYRAPLKLVVLLRR